MFAQNMELEIRAILHFSLITEQCLDWVKVVRKRTTKYRIYLNAELQNINFHTGALLQNIKISDQVKAVLEWKILFSMDLKHSCL